MGFHVANNYSIRTTFQPERSLSGTKHQVRYNNSHQHNSGIIMLTAVADVLWFG